MITAHAQKMARRAELERKLLVASDKSGCWTFPHWLEYAVDNGSEGHHDEAVELYNLYEEMT